MAEGRKCTSGKDSLGRGVAAYAASGISAYENLSEAQKLAMAAKMQVAE